MPATTLDFMPGEIDLVDCFVAGAATCLGTAIGLAINDLRLFEEKEKKDSAPGPMDTAKAKAMRIADVAFNLSSIIATTAGAALAHSCRTSTFWYRTPVPYCCLTLNADGQSPL